MDRALVCGTSDISSILVEGACGKTVGCRRGLTGRSRKSCSRLRERGFKSLPHRQLGNEVIGSPATRARQPFFGEISSRFEFSIKFEPTFFQVLWRFAPRSARRRFQVFLWRQIQMTIQTTDYKILFFQAN